MHVTEESNGQQVIGLHIMNSNGDNYDIEITQELNIEKLKIMCLSYFQNDPLVSIKIAQQFKLVSIEKNRSFNEDSNIKDEDISDGMVLLLLPRYSYRRQTEESLANEMKNRCPNEEDIMDATKHLISKNLDRKMIEISNTIDFQKELRKILISVIDYSEILLRSHPEVKPIFGDLIFDESIDRIKVNNEGADEESNETSDGMSKEILKQLTDMGFAMERAKKALKLNNMSAIDAMDWLLANNCNYESSPSSSSSSRSNQLMDSSKSHYMSVTSLCPRVPAIIECYRAFKRKQFKPNLKAFRGLCDMGFDENEVLDALEIHTNNEIAACEWLLSDRRPKTKDLQYGLSKDSPIFKAIISNPVIQLGLVKPRVFFAFLQLIEEPNSTGKWLSDSQTSPILSQMFRIFHSEKHAIEQSNDVIEHNINT